MLCSSSERWTGENFLCVLRCCCWRPVDGCRMKYPFPNCKFDSCSRPMTCVLVWIGWFVELKFRSVWQFLGHWSNIGLKLINWMFVFFYHSTGLELGQRNFQPKNCLQKPTNPAAFKHKCQCISFILLMWYTEDV